MLPRSIRLAVRSFYPNGQTDKESCGLGQTTANGDVNVKRGVWIVFLLAGVVIGYLAGAGFPGLLDMARVVETSSIGAQTEASGQNEQPVPGEEVALPVPEVPVELKELPQAEWLSTTYYPAASIAYATLNLELAANPANPQTGLGPLFASKELQPAWQQAVTETLGPVGEGLLPLLPECKGIDIFALPPSESTPMGILIHVLWPEPDLTLLSEGILAPVAAGQPDSATVTDRIDGHPLQGVHGPRGEMLILAEQSGVWIANHRAILESLAATRPGDATPPVHESENTLLNGEVSWLTAVARRPVGDLPPNAPLAWLWGGPWHAQSFRIEAGEGPSGSVIAAGMKTGEDAPSDDLWPATFSGAIWRPPASLGRLAFSMPEMRGPMLTESEDSNGENGNDGGQGRRGRRDRNDRGERGEQIQGESQNSQNPSESESMQSGSEERPRRASRGRRGRGRFLPPVNALVIDLVDNGTDDPAWLARLPDPDGKIAEWFTAIHEGTSPIAESVYTEPVQDGAAIAYEFEDGPFLHFFGVDRILVTAKEKEEVLLFEDEAILDQLPALLVPRPEDIEQDSDVGENYLAYADLTPELILAMIAFEAGGDEQAADLAVQLKPFIETVRMIAERSEDQITVKSKAPNTPANVIGLMTLITAIQLLAG